MSEQIDSLDIVELVMAIEEALPSDPAMPPDQRKRLIRDIASRITRGEDDPDDEALAALVRKFGPRSPRGQAGAAVRLPD